MILYAILSLWFFLLTVLSVRPQGVRLAEAWPRIPAQGAQRRYAFALRVLGLVSFVLLWAMTAFRSSNMGNDTEKYLLLFHQFCRDGLSFSTRYEPGYQLLNILIGRFSTDPHVFLIVCSVMMYTGVGVYLLRYSRSLPVSVCLFFTCFFSIYFSALRQAFALVIALYVFQAIKGRKHLLAVLLILLACSFHMTAAALFLLFLRHPVFQKRTLVLAGTLAIALVSASGLLNGIGARLFPMYAAYFEKYALSGWLAISYNTIQYLVYYLLLTAAVRGDSEEDRLVCTNFAWMLLLSAFGYAINVLERIPQYFMMIAVVELPNALLGRKLRHGPFWTVLICAGLLFMLLVELHFRPEWNHLYPYELWDGALVLP